MSVTFISLVLKKKKRHAGKLKTTFFSSENTVLISYFNLFGSRASSELVKSDYIRNPYKFPLDFLF